MHNHSYENEFTCNLHVNEISFSHERMDTKIRFEKTPKVIRKWPIRRHTVKNERETPRKKCPDPCASISVCIRIPLR